MNDLWQDIRHGAHLLRMNLVFTVVAALTLALGIGATTTMFAVVDAVILRPLPFQDPNRLVEIHETTPNGDDFPASEPDYLDFNSGNRSLAGIGAFKPADLTLTGTGDPVRLHGLAVSQSLFPLLGMRATHGRVFRPDEDVAGDSTRVAIVSDAFWRAHFGGDPALVGGSLVLDDKRYTIVGILAPGSQFPPGEIFIPLHASPRSSRTDHWLTLVGRLRPTVAVAAAQTDLSRITKVIAASMPSSAGWGVRVEPLSDALVDANIRRGGWVLLAATGLLLLLACANVANLLLARATTRELEMGVRAAIGASRSRLVRQLAVESAMLVTLAAALGLLGAWWGVSAVGVLGGARIPRLESVQLDWRVALSALVVTIVTGILCGLPPALRATRAGPSLVLGEGARSGTTRGHRRVRDALVAFQIALSLVLLLGAGLLLRSFARLGSVNVGYDMDHVLAVNLSLPPQRYDEPAQAIFYARLIRSLEQQPGVRGAGATIVDPLTGWNLTNDVTPVDRAGSVAAGGFMLAAWRSVTPGFFGAMGVPVIRGRVFSNDDASNGPRIVVVSEQFANRMWPGENPIGKQLFWGGTSGHPRIVVGVVGDIRDVAPQTKAMPTMFVPYNQLPMRTMTVVVRAAGNPMALAEPVRAAIRALDPAIPLADLRPLASNRAAAMSTPRFNVSLIAAFAWLALILASSGVYAVVAYSVAQRRREIGVRLAIGAMPAQVVRSFLRAGLLLTATGAAAGLGAAWALTRLMRGLLFEIEPFDPLTFAGMTVLLCAVTIVASYLPARRAALIAPVQALRD